MNINYFINIYITVKGLLINY